MINSVRQGRVLAPPPVWGVKNPRFRRLAGVSGWTTATRSWNQRVNSEGTYRERVTSVDLSEFRP